MSKWISRTWARIKICQSSCKARKEIYLISHWMMSHWWSRRRRIPRQPKKKMALRAWKLDIVPPESSSAKSIEYRRRPCKTMAPGCLTSPESSPIVMTSSGICNMIIQSAFKNSRTSPVAPKSRQRTTIVNCSIHVMASADAVWARGHPSYSTLKRHSSLIAEARISWIPPMMMRTYFLSLQSQGHSILS